MSCRLHRGVLCCLVLCCVVLSSLFEEVNWSIKSSKLKINLREAKITKVPTKMNKNEASKFVVKFTFSCFSYCIKK